MAFNLFVLTLSAISIILVICVIKFIDSLLRDLDEDMEMLLNRISDLESTVETLNARMSLMELSNEIKNGEYDSENIH